MGRDRKLRDVVEKQAPIGDDADWGTPDSHVFSMDDRELDAPPDGRSGDGGDTLQDVAFEASRTLVYGDGLEPLALEQDNRARERAGRPRGQIIIAGPGESAPDDEDMETVAPGDFDDDALDDALDVPTQVVTPAGAEGSGAKALEAPSRLHRHAVDRVAPDSRLVMMTDPGSRVAEQFRVLALKIKESSAVRALLVAVPTAEVEGAVAAANLALALSEGNRSQVCLVDANLRQGQVGRLFGLIEGSSLLDQLQTQMRVPDDRWTILALGQSLHLVPSDGGAPNPAALLASAPMLDLMDLLRREFDYIVLTAPPLAENADGVIVQDHADAAVLVVRAGVSRQDTVKATLARLGPDKVIGTVLMDVDKLPVEE